VLGFALVHSRIMTPVDPPDVRYTVYPNCGCICQSVAAFVSLCLYLSVRRSIRQSMSVFDSPSSVRVCIRQFVTVLVSPWLHLQVPGCIRQSAAVFVRPWLHSSSRGCIRPSAPVFASPWRYSSVCGCIRQSTAVFVSPWLYSYGFRIGLRG